MKSYIETLHERVADDRRRNEEARVKSARPDSRVLCDVPLRDQIEELMASLPPAQRDRPWSMEEFVVRLQGRFHARPHPMNVGRALRALGWARKRDWSAPGGGRRYWHCPVGSPVAN